MPPTLASCVEQSPAPPAPPPQRGTKATQVETTLYSFSLLGFGTQHEMQHSSGSPQQRGVGGAISEEHRTAGLAPTVTHTVTAGRFSTTWFTGTSNCTRQTQGEATQNWWCRLQMLAQGEGSACRWFMCWGGGSEKDHRQGMLQGSGIGASICSQRPSAHSPLPDVPSGQGRRKGLDGGGAVSVLLSSPNMGFPGKCSLSQTSGGRGFSSPKSWGWGGC